MPHLHNLTVQRSKIYIASCLALLVTSLSFGIRAGILDKLGVGFGLDNQQLASVAATAFWGFPLSVIIGGWLVDHFGAKPILVITFLCHILGIVLTIFSNGFLMLWLSTLMIGLANGFVESVCNPLVAQTYPENKTIKLNHFHLWFPGGIVIGTLVVFLFDEINLNWQFQLVTMLIPAIIYGYIFFSIPIPFKKMKKADLGVAQLRELVRPFFVLMLILMMGTAITELFTNQWVDVLLQSVSDNAILILMITAGVMVIGRAFAAPVVKYFTSLGVLLFSSVLSTIGLWLLATSSGEMLYVSAIIFGLGVCYFWPTMIGFVAENFPKTGALGIAVFGGVGMFAVSIYMTFMGGYYDDIILQQLPAGANLLDFQNAAPGSLHALTYLDAKRMAGPDIIKVTLCIPTALSIIFGLLFIGLRKKNKSNSIN